MKIGSAVFGVHVAVLCVFSLTQGCVTNDTGDQRVAAARSVKGPFKHVHQGKTPDMGTTMDPGYDFGDGMMTDIPVDTGAETGTSDFEITYVPPAVTTESYIVQKGDTLSQLAVDFDTTTANLLSLNNLANPDVLYVGQELRVPAGRGGSRPSTSNSTVSGSTQKAGVYVIQPGDTLSEIAIAAGVSIDALRAANGIDGDMIRAGDELNIPAGGTVPTSTQSSRTNTSNSTPPREDVSTATPPEDPSIPDLPPAGNVPTTDDPPSFIEQVTVYPGDTLETIAADYNTTKDKIMQENGISDEADVREGMTLRIPMSD